MTTYAKDTGAFRVFGVMLMIYTLFCTSCTDQKGSPQANDGNLRSLTVRETADQVLAALQARDGQRLASLVHPEKGVRFSPSAHVIRGEDVVFTRDQVEAFWTDTKTYLWGYAEGSGDPIEMTPMDYAERYILDRDFTHPSSVNVNDDQAAGTTGNNAAEAYPTATRVEYYIEPSAGDSEGGSDWAALRFVFEQVEGSWLLVAVIHDAWSV